MGRALIEWVIVAGVAVVVGFSLFRPRSKYHLSEVEKAAERAAYWNEQLEIEFESHPIIYHFRISADKQGSLRITLWNHNGDAASVNMSRFAHDAPGALCEAAHYLERRMAS